MPTPGHHIAGERVDGTSARTAPVFNPATGQETKRVSLASTEEVDGAVQAAKEAFPGWSKTTPMRRARVMFRYLELLEKHENEIAALITEVHGKVMSDAVGEAKRGFEIVEYATGIPHLMADQFTENVGTQVDSWGLRHPRRMRRHHALQLPRHGAHVDVSGGHRLRKYLRPQAIRKRPLRIAPACRSSQ